MKAVSLIEKEKYAVIEKDEPELRDGFVKVKVHKAGICGSDVHLYWKVGHLAGINYVEGHEFSGEIVDAGDSDYKVGDRVVIVDISPCFDCEYCNTGRYQLCDDVFKEVPGLALDGSIDGGFGEYAICRSDMVRKLPDNISYVEGAMVEPLAISYHACKKAGVKKGDKVLVTGGGTIGLFAAIGASVLGAESVTITEVNEERIKTLSEEPAIDNALNGLASDLDDQLKEISPKGFDVVLECSGNKNAATTGFNHIKKGGTMCIIALADLPEMNSGKLVAEEISIVGSVMFTLDDFEEIIELLGSGKIQVEKYSELIKMDEVQDTVVKIDQGKANALKYVIDISEE